MGYLAPSELTMWSKVPREITPKLNDDEINTKYSKRELRIVTESNREQLPNFVEALKRPGWMERRPFYQRRPRWDALRQSRLIESFIMNVPVPPLFVYESDLAKYEVMDGQQRITAIEEFYSNRLRLEGLEQWPELNGRIYDTLPTEIKKGIDRRSISYIVLLKESASTTEEEALLRQQVFERLNTGGVHLGHQEIRNSLYHGKFNDLLLEMARDPIFRKAWSIPLYTKSEATQLPEDVAKNKTSYLMRDVEIVLRFFALRHAKHYQRGMKGFLDLYMFRARTFTAEDIDHLRSIFQRSIALAQVEEIVATEEIRRIADFIADFCETLAEIVEEEVAGRHLELGKSKTIGSVTHVFHDGKTVIARMAATSISVGDKVLVTNRKRNFIAKIESIQLDDIPSETLLTAEAQDVGIRLSRACRRRAQLYALVPEIPLGVIQPELPLIEPSAVDEEPEQSSDAEGDQDVI